MLMRLAWSSSRSGSPSFTSNLGLPLSNIAANLLRKPSQENRTSHEMTVPSASAAVVRLASSTVIARRTATPIRNKTATSKDE